MSRNIFCIRLQKDAPALDRPPMPGARGQWIYEHVSREGWQDWIAHQTRLINEKHLNLAEPETRTYLAEQMMRFFEGKSFDQAEGYVPEAKK